MYAGERSETFGSTGDSADYVRAICPEEKVLRTRNGDYGSDLDLSPYQDLVSLRTEATYVVALQPVCGCIA